MDEIQQTGSFNRSWPFSPLWTAERFVPCTKNNADNDESPLQQHSWCTISV